MHRYLHGHFQHYCMAHVNISQKAEHLKENNSWCASSVQRCMPEAIALCTTIYKILKTKIIISTTCLLKLPSQKDVTCLLLHTKYCAKCILTWSISCNWWCVCNGCDIPTGIRCNKFRCLEHSICRSSIGRCDFFICCDCCRCC